MIKLKILANKTDLYNNIDFLKKSVKMKSPLEGVGFNIAITKDNKFVVFSPVSDNQTTIQTIANKNLNELKSLDLLTLDYILSFYKAEKYRFKIFLNLIPSSIPITSEESLEALKNINNNYIENLLKAIAPYQDLNLYLGSISDSLINLLKEKKSFAKLGIVLFGGNLNYSDVDFYLFGTGLLSDEIFKQQLDLKKEVMVYVGTSNDLSLVYEHFKGEKSTALANEIFDQILFLNDYPELFFRLFSK